MADDFTISSLAGWQIDQITFFAYQTDAPTSPSPITGVYYQIWDGSPDDPGSVVVYGDLLTNSPDEKVREKAEEAYTDDDRRILQRRLSDLGYLE